MRKKMFDFGIFGKWDRLTFEEQLQNGSYTFVKSSSPLGLLMVKCEVLEKDYYKKPIFGIVTLNYLKGRENFLRDLKIYDDDYVKIGNAILKVRK